MSKTRKKCCSSFHTGRYIMKDGIRYEEVLETEVEISLTLLEQYKKAQNIIYAFDAYYRDRTHKKQLKLKKGLKNEGI